MSKQFFDAIRAGDVNQVSALLNTDTELLQAKDEKGLGPLAVAKYSGRDDIAAILLERGVELDIFEAAMAGREDRVVELAGGRNDLASRYSHDGWTALHLACFFRHAAVAELLIRYGADVNARSSNPMQNMPLHAAAAGRSLESVRLLIAHGADVNARQEGGWTALHAAALNGDVEMARLLITGGADVEARAANQQNALDLALTKGHQEMVNLLDQHAASAGLGR